MWRSLWRSIDRYSLQYFKCRVNDLRKVKAVDKSKKELVVNMLQSIAEAVTYGDRHDPLIFECFMEYQVLAEFVRILKISRNSGIEAPLLQYLSIMIQNVESEHAIHYCFSNDYINSIITHQYNFEQGDLLPYYISFLRAVSSKINRDTLCLLVKVDEDAVVSFPLYTEALKFSDHGEKMIQTAVRALTLNIYNVSDDMVYKFISTPPVSAYFSNLVKRLREQCFLLDALFCAAEEPGTDGQRKKILQEADMFADDLYYLKDIICSSDTRLSRLITENLLSSLVFPILLPFPQLSRNYGKNLSGVTSLIIVSRLLQIVDGQTMANSVAIAMLYPYMASCAKDATDRSKTDDNGQVRFFLNWLKEIKQMVSISGKVEGAENTNINILIEHFSGNGMLSCITSDNYRLLLAFVFLMLILVESKDLDYMLDAVNGPFQAKPIVMQILNALLKVLASQPPFSVLIQWHAGWLFVKLLVFQENKLDDSGYQLFRSSYDHSRECLWKELDGCWLDYIPSTLRNEWLRCKSALEESSLSKDPFFMLELDFHKQTAEDIMSSSLAWQRMVDKVKVFVLHLQLKAFISNREGAEKLLLRLRSSILSISRNARGSDLSAASFGSELALDWGVPCKIAISTIGSKDIYMIPVASGISGKLLLLEKHPLHSRRGVVIASAPLAGLDPKVDENQMTWLHLRIREFSPEFHARKAEATEWNASDGRWTLGFADAVACKAAQQLIVEEMYKQRSCVESFLGPLLGDDSRDEDLFVNRGS